MKMATKHIVLGLSSFAAGVLLGAVMSGSGGKDDPDIQSSLSPDSRRRLIDDARAADRAGVRRLITMARRHDDASLILDPAVWAPIFHLLTADKEFETIGGLIDLLSRSQAQVSPPLRAAIMAEVAGLENLHDQSVLSLMRDVNANRSRWAQLLVAQAIIENHEPEDRILRHYRTESIGNTPHSDYHSTTDRRLPFGDSGVAYLHIDHHQGIPYLSPRDWILSNSRIRLCWDDRISTLLGADIMERIIEENERFEPGSLSWIQDAVAAARACASDKSTDMTEHIDNAHHAYSQAMSADGFDMGAAISRYITNALYNLTETDRFHKTSTRTIALSAFNVRTILEGAGEEGISADEERDWIWNRMLQYLVGQVPGVECES